MGDRPGRVIKPTRLLALLYLLVYCVECACQTETLLECVSVVRFGIRRTDGMLLEKSVPRVHVWCFCERVGGPP